MDGDGAVSLLMAHSCNRSPSKTKYEEPKKQQHWSLTQRSYTLGIPAAKLKWDRCCIH